VVRALAQRSFAKVSQAAIEATRTFMGLSATASSRAATSALMLSTWPELQVKRGVKRARDWET
jgi:hypothetical protein